MKDGKQIGHEALSFFQDINKRLQAYKASEQMQLLTKQEIIEEIKELYTVRYNRVKLLWLFILDKPFRGPFAVNQYDLIKAIHYIERLN